MATWSELFENLTPIFTPDMGQRMKLVRAKMKMSQTEFAEKLGISQKGVSQLERGNLRVMQRPVSVKVLQTVVGKELFFVIKGAGMERFSQQFIWSEYWKSRFKKQRARKGLRRKRRDNDLMLTELDEQLRRGVKIKS